MKVNGKMTNNMVTIIGVFSYNTGDTFTGIWENDLRKGHGLVNYITGSGFIGEYNDDVRNGYGTRTWWDGTKWYGYWKNHLPVGKGEYTFKDGSKFQGELYLALFESFEIATYLESNNAEVHAALELSKLSGRDLFKIKEAEIQQIIKDKPEALKFVILSFIHQLKIDIELDHPYLILLDIILRDFRMMQNGLYSKNTLMKFNIAKHEISGYYCMIATRGPTLLNLLY